MNQLRSTDLRLGNLVLFRGKICKVTTLSGDIIRVDEPEVGIVEQAYPKTPIELTPEVLKLCEETMYDKLINEKGDMVADMIGAGEIKYLHQLQNVYHALVGEELTISLPTVKMEEK